MLLGYPVAATDENWLHDGIVAILMLALGGEAEPMADWLDHFPAEHREAVRRKTSLSDRLTKAVEAIGALDPPERSHLETCLREQNRLPEAFSSLVSPPLVQEEPADVREKLKALFGTAFSLLSSLGVRDRQYASVYHGTPGHVCGFCGDGTAQCSGARHPARTSGPLSRLQHLPPRRRQPAQPRAHRTALQQLAQTGRRHAAGPRRTSAAVLRPLRRAKGRGLAPREPAAPRPA